MDAVRQLSNTHDDIMNVMVANPMASHRDLSALTGYSETWLSRLVNSDIFRARLAEKKGEVFVMVAQDVPAKLSALAHQSIDKLAEKLTIVEDPDFALDTFDKVMKANGFAPGGGRQVAPAQQQNNFFITKEDLARARTAITSEGNEIRTIENEVAET